MGYTHNFNQQEDFDQNRWSAIKKAVVDMVKNLPEHTETAGGYMAEYRLKGNIVAFDPEAEFGAGPIITSMSAETIVQPDPDDSTNEMIWFNGNPQEELDHEPFVLHRKKIDEAGADFCKTARKPYDLLVCATLIVADHVAPGFLEIGGGGVDDWMPALEFVRDECFANAKLPEGVDPQGTTRVAGVSYELDPVPLEVVREDAKGAPSNLYF